MNRNQRIHEPEQVKALFAKASPKEREQIAAFARAHTERGFPANLFLMRITNHDTGKQFLTVGACLKGDGESLPANAFRKAIGLPPISLKLVKPTPTAPKPVKKVLGGISLRKK